MCFLKVPAPWSKGNDFKIIKFKERKKKFLLWHSRSTQKIYICFLFPWSLQCPCTVLYEQPEFLYLFHLCFLKIEMHIYQHSLNLNLFCGGRKTNFVYDMRNMNKLHPVYKTFNYCYIIQYFLYIFIFLKSQF